MINSQTSYRYLKFLSFKSLLLWDVKAYIGNILTEGGNNVKLSRVLTEIKIPLSRAQVIENGYHIISKINFSGVLYLRKPSEINVYKGNLFLVPTNTIIFSKINARHGCIYFNGAEPFVVSSEYPVFSIDASKVDGKYLHLILRTSKVKEHLASKITGVSKPRLKQSEFLNLPIPLPMLNKQKELVNTYYGQVELAEQQVKEVHKLEQKIENRICELLGLSIIESNIKKGISVFSFKVITKWSVDYILKQGSLTSLRKSIYPVIPLGQIIDYLQYGISEKSNVSSKGTAVLRMNNIQNRKIETKSLKHYDFENSRLHKEKVLLQRGDMLFNRTNSKELVGKTAVFDLDGEYTFASYLIRLRFNKYTNPYYVNYLLNSQIGRIQMDLISRQILGQANINAEELKGIVIPLPSLEIQDTIVNELNNIVLEQETLLSKSKQNKSFAVQHFEQSVFNL